MSLLKRNQPPSPEQISASARSVIETVRETGLSPESTLIMGGSALALAGLRPAGDVDLIIPEYVYHSIRYNTPYATPSGMRLRLKAHTIYPVLETYDKPRQEDIMHVDITTPKRDYGSDAEFETELRQYEMFEGYPFLPPDLVLERKMRSAERNRKKDRDDIDLVWKHLEEMKRDGN
ncbi:MAG: hypothetical protein JWP06_88 [Candidatus Saccharibacteria bacterium]|nr:hypothetical protein [Candidatus Saccharibacteria bacterium]